MPIKLIFRYVILLFILCFNLNAESDIKKISVYEFSKKPTIKREGNSFSISFAVKEACDVTIAIVDSNKKAIRHIASGLLGKNSPEPFAKNSLSQKILWDGKNDYGRLLDDYSSLSVRVSLGLKAKFERTLYWSPHKRTKSAKYRMFAPIMYATPEGVYVYDGKTGDHITKFNHKGDYEKTVFPAPANKIKAIKGLVWKKFPQDGHNLPMKGGKYFNEFLTTNNLGDTSKINIRSSGGVKGLAVLGNKIYLTGTRINFLSTDGSSGGRELSGPEVWKSVRLGRMHNFPGGTVKMAVSSVAPSEDGKWIYLTGYFYVRSWHQGGLNGVARLSTKHGSKPELFVGSLKQYTSKKRPGNKNGVFDVATCVAVDSKGRVYVGDYGNDRIQVFDENKKHLKNIPVKKPAHISINPNNGEIYVFSYKVPFVMHDKGMKVPIFTRLGSYDNPKVLASMKIKMNMTTLDDPGGRCTVDFWGKEPVIWIADTGTHASFRASREKLANIKMYVEKKGKLVKIRDFHDDAIKKVALARGTRHGKQRLFFDYKNEKLFVSEIWGPAVIHCTSMADSAKIDPETGKIEHIFLPIDAEDMAFDLNGLAYLRTQNRIARFDAKTWKEIPFDYGAEYKAMTTWHVRKRDVISAITYNGFFESSSQLGGMAISPKGHIVITAYNPTNKEERTKGGAQNINLAPYRPNMYPGRASSWNLHVWDEHGKIIYKDAVAGLGRPVGVRMDVKDNLYIMQAGQGKLNGKYYYSGVSCTYVKTKPGTKFVATKAIIDLGAEMRPKREPDIKGLDYAGDLWAIGAEWTLGGVGIDGKRNKCHCASQSRPALDLYARSFLPETDRYSVLVIDTNGNKILRIGKYGNVDDGMPMIKDGGPPNPISIGGDEVAIVHNQFLTVQSDRRLFIGDLGNSRVLSVKLEYHKSEYVSLK
ncbi:MAG: hypothetical protein COA79_26380 [Planctomycetota bacterium]|nr:MAG: hypothetical protein COA79_26380 [Planctomycetota bacterium]